ncbi:hypothetical protein CAter282_0662 [Collimonas arenae]|uniref:Uncharacterized protein n=1 Tax=Collimonas arenae TaxID=279058 RepID=A0A127QEI2_9BURK|nr:hypothetical protein CAter282_0662 [Collimonas arenae]
MALEACFAFFVFAFIVWWTMFSGRKPDQKPPAKPLPPKDDSNAK